MVVEYPPANKIASPTELKEKYEKARNEISSYKQMANIANISARDLAKDKHKYKKEA